MRILILTNAYPPDLQVAARRWGGIVPELTELGHVCTVICNGDTNPDIYQNQSGEQVIRLPLSKAPAPPPEWSAYSRLKIKRRVKALLRPMIPLFLRSIGKNSWLRAIKTSSDALFALSNADLIIASYGPMPPLRAGAFLAKRYNIPLVIDIRDSFQARDLNSLFWARWTSRQLEKRLLNRACLRITIGERLAEYLASVYKMQFSAIYNGWICSDLNIIRGKAITRDHYLYYAGSIYKHQLPALQILLEALQSFPNLRLRIRLLHDNTDGAFDKLLKAKAYINLFDILPPASSQTVSKEINRAIGVLVLENLTPSPLHDGTVTGKLFQLLSSGAPGLVVCSLSSEIGTLIRPLEHWHIAEDICTIKRAIQSITESEHAQPEVSGILPYSAKAQSMRLHKMLLQVMEPLHHFTAP